MQRHPSTLSPSQPFLKYAGGKQRLLPQLKPHLRLRGRLVEPFVGGGSVFLGSDYSRYLLNDANPDLMAVWAALKERPRQYTNSAAAFFSEANCSQEAYLAIRRDFNQATDRFERAIRLPYLNKHCFNGLYRTNAAGEFNVPWGGKKSVPVFPWDAMAHAATKLERCTLLCGDFSTAIELSGYGDVVYCDPPYLDSTAGQSFTGYTPQGFRIDDHLRLTQLARQAVERGATVLISNHDTEESRELYAGFDLITLSVHRSISASAMKRRECRELLAVLEPSSQSPSGFRLPGAV